MVIEKMRIHPLEARIHLATGLEREIGPTS
jgi:hypothetical protein